MSEERGATTRDEVRWIVYCDDPHYFDPFRVGGGDHEEGQARNMVNILGALGPSTPVGQVGYFAAPVGQDPKETLAAIYRERAEAAPQKGKRRGR